MTLCDVLEITLHVHWAVIFQILHFPCLTLSVVPVNNYFVFQLTLSLT